jgi:signal transduction histidine kinase
LGLDIARRTAELSGGGLDLNDRPGGGAVVKVWFG